MKFMKVTQVNGEEVTINVESINFVRLLNENEFSKSDWSLYKGGSVLSLSGRDTFSLDAESTRRVNSILDGYTLMTLEEDIAIPV